MHRRLLRHEDLEDCYSQATCELIAQARAGSLHYNSRAHLLNTLQLRFTSRVTDRRRALRGRSPAQAVLDEALSVGTLGEHAQEVADPQADVERRVLLRFELRSLEDAAHALTPDQRLVLACQIGLQMDAAEFCTRFGWSAEKHRKVAQRARSRLRRLLDRPVVSACESHVEREASFVDSPAVDGTAGDGPAAGGPTARPIERETDFSFGRCPVARRASGDMAGTLL